MDALITALSQVSGEYVNIYFTVMRFLFPVLVGLLLYLCGKPLLTFRREPEIWGWMIMPNGDRLPITHWENIIGRGKQCDIVLDVPSVSKSYAVLSRFDDGSWKVTCNRSNDNVLVNGECVNACTLETGDSIIIGGIEMHFEAISQEGEIAAEQLQSRSSTCSRNILTLLLLSFMQILLSLAFLLGGNSANGFSIIEGFGGLLLCQWLLFGSYCYVKRPAFELETIAFLLCSMGMAVVCAVEPGETTKQLIALLAGLVLFLCIRWFLQDIERVKKARSIAIVAGVGFLFITLLFGKEFFGAKNWIVIGSLSIQPSELSKVCFVFVGACSLERVVKRLNLLLFIAYSALICGCLAIMNDFGTALIFFSAFLVVIYLRTGDAWLVGLAVASLAIAGIIVLNIAPHALRRLSSWRHIWEDRFNTGYQQTQGLMCIAAGGLFGLGAGQGLAKYIFASGSDMVFATVSEEWGLITAVMMPIAIVILALFAVRSASTCRRSFNAMAGCIAASILVVQTILNVLGSLDVLPLTGVTFPFLSNGGTSMISVWGLLALVKAGDSRQYVKTGILLANLGEVENERDCTEGKICLDSGACSPAWYRILYSRISRWGN